MPSPTVTALIRFPGETLAEVLSTSELVVAAYDPYQNAQVDVHEQDVPLAANFTAGYGLWLARSGFARQSFRSCFGSERGIDHPHLYLMQPYDPNKRILLMVHGLASSPEAWVNVANELMGDEELRQAFSDLAVLLPHQHADRVEPRSDPANAGRCHAALRPARRRIAPRGEW